MFRRKQKNKQRFNWDTWADQFFPDGAESVSRYDLHTNPINKAIVYGQVFIPVDVVRDYLKDKSYRDECFKALEQWDYDTRPLIYKEVQP